MPDPPDSSGREDFAAILARFEAEQAAAPSRGGGARPGIGDKVRGQIVGFGEDVAFVDLGAKSEGMISLDELRDEEGRLTVAVGEAVEGVVAATDRDTGSLILRVRPGRSGAGGEAAWAELRQAFEARIPVEGRVSGVNKGGFDVEVSGVRAFCPVSQIDLAYVENPADWVGRRLTFRITRFSEGRGRRPDVVLSRRELLAEEAAARAAEALARLAVGQVVKGTVTSLTGYGAFVDLGGIEGLLHVSEISHSRIADPAEVLAVGQPVEVEVLKIEPAKERGGHDRISLSLRSLEPDPWRHAAERYPEGMVLPGKVVRLEPYGAFVEIAPGLDGLVHVSELATDRRVDHPRQVVEVGQEVTVKVLSVDAEKRRISLTMSEPGSEEGGGEVGTEPAAAPEAGGSLGTLGDAFAASKKRRG